MHLFKFNVHHADVLGWVSRERGTQEQKCLCWKFPGGVPGSNACKRVQEAGLRRGRTNNKGPAGSSVLGRPFRLVLNWRKQSPWVAKGISKEGVHLWPLIGQFGQRWSRSRQGDWVVHASICYSYYSFFPPRQERPWHWKRWMIHGLYRPNATQWASQAPHSVSRGGRKPGIQLCDLVIYRWGQGHLRNLQGPVQNDHAESLVFQAGKNCHWKY